MTEKITYEIYTDNPPPGSRPLKSQVSELRKEIQNMRLTEEEIQVINECKSICEDQACSAHEEQSFDKKGRWLKKAAVLTKLLERLQ